MNQKVKNSQHKLLFVCLGNICRSPAAEGVMKEIVAQAGAENQYIIDSAGIGSWHVGQLPDVRMRRHGAARGYLFNSHARQFTPSDFDAFDSIFVMDQNNFRDVTSKARSKEDAEKVKFLANFLQDHPLAHEIPDPYYGESSDFDYALDLIEDACQSLFKKLQKNG